MTNLPRSILPLVVLLMACGAAPPVTPPVTPPVDATVADLARPPQCTPGAQVACACLGSVQGVQVCAADGTFAACQCPDAGEARDAGDAAVAADDGAADAPTDLSPSDVSHDATTPDTGCIDAGSGPEIPTDLSPEVRITAHTTTGVYPVTGTCSVTHVPGFDEIRVMGSHCGDGACFDLAVSVRAGGDSFRLADRDGGVFTSSDFGSFTLGAVYTAGGARRTNVRVNARLNDACARRVYVVASGCLYSVTNP